MLLICSYKSSRNNILIFMNDAAAADEGSSQQTRCNTTVQWSHQSSDPQYWTWSSDNWDQLSAACCAGSAATTSQELTACWGTLYHCHLKLNIGWSNNKESTGQKKVLKRKRCWKPWLKVKRRENLFQLLIVQKMLKGAKWEWLSTCPRIDVNI